MQIIVYTGAIMILFLFVLMLVGRDSSDSVVETLRGQRVAATVLGVGFAGLVGAGIARATEDLPVTGLAARGPEGNIPAIAELLFTDYLLAFEVTSALLITAAVGAMVLAHIEREPGSRRTPEGAVPGAVPRRAAADAARPRRLRPGQLRRRARRCCPTAASPRTAWPPASSRRRPTRCRGPRAAAARLARTRALGTLDPAPLDGPAGDDPMTLT